MSIDLDRLWKLAKEDRAGFEAERQKLMDDLVLHTPPEHQARLRGFLWKIDLAWKHRPVSTLADIYLVEDMLSDYLYLLTIGLRARGVIVKENPIPPPRVYKQPAQVLAFKQKKETEA